jgi:hypothetical protein
VELLGLLGVSAFAFASLVLGVKLVALARRTRQFPELAIGLSFLLAGFVGLGLLLAAQEGGFDPVLALRLRLAGMAVSNCGYALLASFVWRVFRPGSRAGRLGFAACVAGLAIGLAAQWWQSEPTPVPVAHAGFWLSLATQIGAYLWAASESFGYWWMLRKRVALGLADPLVANRFLLWGIGTSAVIGIWLHMGASIARRAQASMTDVDFLVIAALGFTCAVTCWIAFLPPRGYVRRFERVSPR